MPLPRGPVMNGCWTAVARVGMPYHLPGIVYSRSTAAGPAQRAKIPHANAARSGDESMAVKSGDRGKPDHLPSIVDAISHAIVESLA
jgi:hypothetical protein